jgi:hypothetical protein
VAAAAGEALIDEWAVLGVSTSVVFSGFSFDVFIQRDGSLLSSNLDGTM